MVEILEESVPAPERETATAARGRWRRLLTALGAGSMYGAWAGYANWSEGHEAALVAAGAQSLLSITATLTLVIVLEFLFQWPRSDRKGFWLASIGTSTIGTSAMVAGHKAADTPQLVMTIAPSVVIGAVFFFAYSAMLVRLSKREGLSSASTRACSTAGEPSAGDSGGCGGRW